jgi:uncharacterized lipoprotein YajG
MKTKTLGLLGIVGSVLILQGCEVRGPSLKVTPPSVEVEGAGHGHGNGTHCPPGQAKKGRC